MNSKLYVAIAALALCSCTDSGGAKRAAEAAGLTNVEVTGYRVFGCGDDTFKTGFKGQLANGKYVSGVVCSGWLKGSTIRFD